MRFDRAGRVLKVQLVLGKGKKRGFETMQLLRGMEETKLEQLSPFLNAGI